MPILLSAFAEARVSLGVLFLPVEGVALGSSKLRGSFPLLPILLPVVDIDSLSRGVIGRIFVVVGGVPAGFAVDFGVAVCGVLRICVTVAVTQ